MSDEIPQKYQGMADEAHRIVPALEEAYGDDEGVRVTFAARFITVEFDHGTNTDIHFDDGPDSFGLVDWPVPVEVEAVSVNPAPEGFTAVRFRAAGEDGA